MDHDEGAYPSGWLHADAIIMGVPYTGKSVISVYLGTLGHKVANITLDGHTMLPPEFEKVDKRRVFGLINRSTRSARPNFANWSPPRTVFTYSPPHQRPTQSAVPSLIQPTLSFQGCTTCFSCHSAPGFNAAMVQQAFWLPRRCASQC